MVAPTKAASVAAKTAANKAEFESRLATAVQHLTDGFLSCRDFGHVWRMSNLEILERNSGYVRTFFCRTCKTNRIQVIDRRGGIVKNTYDYPKGYQIKGLGHINADFKADLRLESIMREVQKRDAKSVNAVK